MKDLVHIGIKAVLEAGEKICDIYGTDDFKVQEKADESPLTIADLQANEIIKDNLKSTNIPILSEEGKQISYDERKSWNKFWLVDPLDGTKEFIKRNGEFTVNIALVENNAPVLGFVYVPVKKELYFTSESLTAYKAFNVTVDSKIEDVISKAEPLPLKQERTTFMVVASKSHLSDETKDFIDALREEHPNLEFLSKGSSLKLCMVAEGSADIYPRLGPTMEWDTGAAHAVALAAGKKVIRHDDGKELLYNKENLLNPYFIVK